MSTDVRLRRFIKAELDRTPTATKFVLRLGDVDGHTDLTDSWPVKARIMDTARESETLAAEIWDRANDEAAGQVGIVHLHLLSYIGGKKKVKQRGKDVEAAPDDDGKLKRRAKFSFTRRGMANNDDKGLLISESEPATKQGFLGMMMRHFENRESVMLGALQGLTEGVREENSNLRARLATIEDNWLEARKHQELLLDRHHERQLALDAQANEEERKRALVGTVMNEVIPQLAGHIPSVLSKLGLGGPPAPPPADGDIRKELREILFSLPQEKAMELLEALPADKKTKFVAIMEGKATGG